MCHKPRKEIFNFQSAIGNRQSAILGFSLLELVLVLAIVATLAAIAIPRYQGSLARYRADLAARRIVADLSLARSNAKADSSSRSVVFSVSANNYQMPDLPGLDGASGSYIVELRGLPYEADLISADFGGDQQVIFSGWGIPDSGGSVVLTVGSEQRTVVVDAESGKATIQ